MANKTVICRTAAQRAVGVSKGASELYGSNSAGFTVNGFILAG